MISRRHALGGGASAVAAAISGVLATAADAEAAPAVQRGSDTEDELRRIVSAISGIRAQLETERRFTEIGAIRDAQKTFLRVNAKFPDYIEVGTDVWFDVHDWHIRWQQPLTLGRDPLGRYTIVLNQTQVIMRIDSLPGFVGQPYDNR